MKIAIYPGSFDPITLGHLDIIIRSSKLFDKVIIGILNNSQKHPLFSVDERVNMIKELVSDIDNVEVQSFAGLTIDFAKNNNADVIIRGLRGVTDFEVEMQIAQANKKQCPEIETLFLATSLEYSYLSSTVAKEFASYNRDISAFVPELVLRAMEQKVQENKENQ